MKYELISLDDSFKNNTKNLYMDDNGNSCIDISEILENNEDLKYLIAIFINGVLLETFNYKLDNNVVTISKNYDAFATDRIYMLFTSVSEENGGYIHQYRLGDFSVLDNDSISLAKPLTVFEDSEIIAFTINGVSYSKDDFTIDDEFTISFDKYRPDEIDDINILVLQK